MSSSPVHEWTWRIHGLSVRGRNDEVSELGFLHAFHEASTSKLPSHYVSPRDEAFDLDQIQRV